MLSALLNPQQFGNGTQSFLDALVEWETDISRYELQAGKEFADDYRIATLMVHSPEPYKTVVRNAPVAARAS